MFDPKQLLDQVLGGNSGQGLGGPLGGGLGQMANQARERFNQASNTQAFGAGALSGGLLGLLLGGKKMRKLAGGTASHGGAAVLGAIAYQAYQNYRQSQGGSSQVSAPINPAQTLAQTAPALLPHSQPAADGGPFALVLVRGMIAAAKADGHVDAAEQNRLFTEVERLSLDGEAKALVFDQLAKPVDVAALAAQVATPEQAAELYLASRLAIDPDQAAERAYLDALATRLKIPPSVRSTLDAQLTD